MNIFMKDQNSLTVLTLLKEQLYPKVLRLVKLEIQATAMEIICISRL